MAFSHAKVDVGQGTLLHKAEGTDGARLVILNNGAATLYIGASGVTNASGFPVASQEWVAVDLDNRESVYGWVASGTLDVRLLRGRE